MIKYLLILSLFISSLSFAAEADKDTSTPEDGSIKRLTEKRKNRKKHPYSRIDADYKTDSDSSSESEYEIERNERTSELNAPKLSSDEQEKKRVLRHNESEKKRRSRLVQERTAILQAQIANTQTLLKALEETSDQESFLLKAATRLSLIDPGSSAVMMRGQDFATLEGLKAEFNQADELDQKASGKGISHEQKRMLFRSQVNTKALVVLDGKIQSNRAISDLISRQIGMLAAKHSSTATMLPAPKPIASGKKDPIMFSWQLPRSEIN